MSLWPDLILIIGSAFACGLFMDYTDWRRARRDAADDPPAPEQW